MVQSKKLTNPFYQSKASKTSFNSLSSKNINILKWNFLAMAAETFHVCISNALSLSTFFFTFSLFRKFCLHRQHNPLENVQIFVDSYHTFVPLKPFTMGSLTELCPCQYPLFPPFKNQLSSKYALYRSAFQKMH